MNKRLGVDPIQSAQFREMSDFIFDLESALITIDTTRRKTYTVPFLEKEDRYSTFNLVVVTDSLDNLLDQYILQYGFDSLQYSSFLASGDFLQSGAEIKRFSFSSFFNDSNPLSLERCQGISDENGDPIVCDEVTIDAGSSGGGGTSGGGTAWIPSGGGGGGTGLTCSWVVYIIPCNCHPHHTTQACGCQDGKPRIAMQITCKSPNMRNSYPSQSQMTCMDCDISDFGTPAFTPTKVSTAINRDLGGILSDYHLWYLSDSPSFASEFRSALLTDVTVDVDAALFTLAAGMNGVLDGDFNSNFGIAIEDLMTESTADFSNPDIIRIFQNYFEVNYANLKQLNPSWSSEKLFYETSKEAIHFDFDKLPGGKYWESEEYLRKLMATLQEYRLQAGPGVKDYSALNNSEKFLHILSHVNHNRHLRQNFKTTDIMSNVPRIAPAGPFKLPGGWYESSEAAIRINGKVYRIGYVFGNQHGYNYVNMMQLPDITFPVGKDQFNVYYMDVNVPGRTALEIYFPKELYQWFMENYYY